jgi:hypothetical protein
MRRGPAPRDLLLWPVCLILVTIQLHSDVLGVLDPAYRASFQVDSDEIVLNRLRATDLGLFDPMVDLNHQPYLSQFGLQGMVMALLSPGDTLASFYRWTVAALLAAVLVLAARALAGRVSTGAGVALLVLLVVSPWLNAFGVSVYWQLWTLLVPCLVPLLLWDQLRRHGWWPALVLIAGLVFIKALCGYEFITTVILGATAAACFHEFRGRIDVRLFKVVAGTVAAGIAGFGLAMACHVAQLTIGYGGVSAIGDRSSERTFSPEDFDRLVSDVRPRAGYLGWLFDLNEHLGLWVYLFRGYVFDPAVKSPSFDGAVPVVRGWIALFILGYFVAAGWLWHRHRTSDGRVLLEDRLAVAAGIGLVGAMSWLVLAYGHAINHPHIDAIVFYVPFLPFCYALLVTLGAHALNRPRLADS